MSEIVGSSAFCLSSLGATLHLLRLFISSALPPRPCTGGLPYLIGLRFVFLLWGWQALPRRHVTPRTPHVGGYQRICYPLESCLLRSRLCFSSSIVAFRCSRVVINGTRSAMGNSLISLGAVGTKYLLLFMGFSSPPRHYFGQTEEIFFGDRKSVV